MKLNQLVDMGVPACVLQFVRNEDSPSINVVRAFFDCYPRSNTHTQRGPTTQALIPPPMVA